MKLQLDGNAFDNREQLHEEIARQLAFPDYYGENLDALWDILSSWAEPLEINVVNSEGLIQYLGGYGEAILELFQEAEDENAAITVSLE